MCDASQWRRIDRARAWRGARAQHEGVPGACRGGCAARWRPLTDPAVTHSGGGSGGEAVRALERAGSDERRRFRVMEPTAPALEPRRARGPPWLLNSLPRRSKVQLNLNRRQRRAQPLAPRSDEGAVHGEGMARVLERSGAACAVVHSTSKCSSAKDCKRVTRSLKH